MIFSDEITWIFISYPSRLGSLSTQTHKMFSVTRRYPINTADCMQIHVYEL